MEFDKLSLEAQNIVLSVQNTNFIWLRIQNLIESLSKKIFKGKELSQEILENSSILEQICSLGIKELKNNSYTELNIKTTHRKEFKKYYAEYIIEEAESHSLNL